MKTISRFVSQGQQSWELDGMYEHYEVKLRVLVRRNAYDRQSYAHCDVFSPTNLCWNRLVDIPFGVMQSLPLSYVENDRATVDRYLSMDEAELLRLATALI
jgi:hypothetical protein